MTLKVYSARVVRKVTFSTEEIRHLRWAMAIARDRVKEQCRLLVPKPSHKHPEEILYTWCVDVLRALDDNPEAIAMKTFPGAEGDPGGGLCAA